MATGISAATAMELAPGGDLWVLEQTGAVKRFRSGSTVADLVGNVSVLGLSSIGERGLLGIAFDPQYAVSKQVYLYYTATTPTVHNRISRFVVDDTNAADYFFTEANGVLTEEIIFELDPLSGATNHNGGAIHFGPDGKLYAAVGDNANGSNSQTLGNLHGKILRINSDGSIPTDNPFFGVATDEERAIWALGLRNPFTFAFEPGTGRMFINDVGQNTFEEINPGVAGANYGWPSMEGDSGNLPSGPGSYVGPLYTYGHGFGPFVGFAITGGAFYNPTVQQFPASFVGDYFFADFGSNWINVRDDASGNVATFAAGASAVVDLRVAPDGSLYYLSRGAGSVFRVTFENPPTPWNNTALAVDVNNDGFVSPIDAVLVINLLNGNVTDLPTPTSQFSPPPYYDVSPDNKISPIDALLVISALNAQISPPTTLVAGEGESAGSALAAAAETLAEYLAQEALAAAPRKRR